MGNCLFGGLGVGEEEDFSIIKVIKSDGEVVEFHSPVTAGSVSDEFSGHAVFSSLDLLEKPLPHHDHLLPGQHYYLLPSTDSNHVRSNSESFPPFRMSLDYNHWVLKRSYTDVFSRNIYSRTRHHHKEMKRKKRNNKCGIWKVKLVINTDDLLQILSEDGRTSELIESMRAVAKGDTEYVVASAIPSDNDLSVVHV